MNENLSFSKYKTLIIIAVIALVILCIVGSLIGKYNNLVNLEENVNLAYSNVQKEMQARLELIPDLVETVKSYTKHEESVYEDIANARAALSSGLQSQDIKAIDQANTKLNKALNNLLVIVESYPQLKAGEQYTSLMDQLEGRVNRISIARETYNEKVNEYNKKIRMFPQNIYASIFGFESKEIFSASEGADNTNMVNFND